MVMVAVQFIARGGQLRAHAIAHINIMSSTAIAYHLKSV